MIRSRAPVRISLGGGGTDISPYKEEHGGIVLSTTIDRYAYCTVAKAEKFTAESPFAETVMNHFKESENPISVLCFTEAPAGSGLGGSSSLMVAIIKAVSTYYDVKLTAHEIAEMAYIIERKELGIEGGWQDQFAAAYGGWNLMKFSQDGTKVIPIYPSQEILRELLASLILVDLGKSRISSGIIKNQIESYERPEILQVLDSIKVITKQMLKELIKGNTNELGLLLSEEWNEKKKLSKRISNRMIEKFHAGMLRHGAIGGKLLGAGEGGHMIFLSDLSKRKRLLDYINDSGFQHIPFRFDSQGVVAWTMK